MEPITPAEWRPQQTGPLHKGQESSATLAKPRSVDIWSTDHETEALPSRRQRACRPGGQATVEQSPPEPVHGQRRSQPRKGIERDKGLIMPQEQGDK